MKSIMTIKINNDDDEQLNWTDHVKYTKIRLQKESV